MNLQVSEVSPFSWRLVPLKQEVAGHQELPPGRHLAFAQKPHEEVT